MRKPFPGRQSATDFKRSKNAAFRALGMSEFVVPVKEKIARIKRPVDGKLVKPTEYQEQGAVIEWWWRVHKMYGLPVFSLFSVPNGSYLANAHYGASMLKKAGMRNGAPDLVLAKPQAIYHGLYIEMKSENGVESTEQRAFGEYLESVGYKFSFCYGASPAITEIETYLAGGRE